MKEAEIRNYLTYNSSEEKILSEIHFHQQLKTSSTNAFD